MKLRRPVLHSVSASPVVVAAVFLWPHMAQAVRSVGFQIYVDGKLVLVAGRGDTGQAPDVVWGYLRTLKFASGTQYRKAKGGYAEVKPDANDPLTATLTGTVQIKSNYGGNADLTYLKLIRTGAGKEEWQLAPEEVERTFKLRKESTKPNG